MNPMAAPHAIGMMMGRNIMEESPIIVKNTNAVAELLTTNDKNRNDWEKSTTKVTASAEKTNAAVVI